MNFTYRIRFNISSRSNLAAGFDGNEIVLSDGARKRVLYSGEADKPIHKAKSLVFKGSKYRTLGAAEKAGLRYQDILKLTLARLRIGADFATRRGQGGVFFDSFLQGQGKEIGERILNDTHGLMVYESNPLPKFASLGGSFKFGCSKDRFEEIFKAVEETSPKINDRERTSLELFHASFFTETADTKLIALVMAIECLIKPKRRNASARKHVDHLIKSTKENQALSSADKCSFLGSLKWLYEESVGQAGRRLVTDRLGNKKYMGLPPDKFFSKVYALRSNLVHGEIPFPEWEKVGQWAADLEVFVADLIGYRIRDAH